MRRLPARIPDLQHSVLGFQGQFQRWQLLWFRNSFLSPWDPVSSRVKVETLPGRLPCLTAFQQPGWKMRPWIIYFLSSLNCLAIIDHQGSCSWSNNLPFGRGKTAGWKLTNVHKDIKTTSSRVGGGVVLFCFLHFVYLYFLFPQSVGVQSKRWRMRALWCQ